jgi:hypothetical protein
MRKSQNRSIGNKRRQGNMIPQKVNNHKIEDMVDSEGDKYSGTEVRRITRMLRSLKRTYKNNSMNPRDYG